jgi:amino acid adenylation domain-containing protein
VAAEPGFHLSPQQARLWQLRGEAGRARAEIELAGELNPQRLDDALRALAARHEILRTSFASRPELRLPVQVIGSPERLRRELHPRNGATARLRLELPALCADAGTLARLFEELADCYEGRPLPEDPLQYADFAQWRRDLLAAQDERARAAREHWAAQPLRAPAIPFARQAPPGPRRTLPVALDRGRFQALLAAAGCTPAELLLSAWVALLARLSGQEAVTVGVVHDGRDRDEELAGALGPLAQTLPVSVEACPDAGFDRMRREVAARLAAAVAAAPQLALDPARRLSAGFEWRRLPAARSAGALRLHLERVQVEGEPFALALIGGLHGRRAHAWLEYDEHALDEPAASAFAAELAELVRSAAADPRAPLGTLPLIGPAVRERLAAAHRGTAPEQREPSVAERFEQRARLHPDRPALACGARQLSYRELEQRANRLARDLRARGAGPGTVVGVLMRRCAEAIVALLATLKAGAAYLPLAVDHPPDRLAHHLRDAGARLLVICEEHRGLVGAFGGEVVCAEREAEEIAAHAAAPLPQAAGPEELAYVIYTSGSTGEPKGVGIPHGALANYSADMARRLAGEGGPPRSFALVSTLATDLGHTAIYPALTSGGCLHVIDDETALDGALYAAYARRHPIDVLKITPSHLRALLSAGGGAVLPRETLVLGGEPCPWDLVDLAAGTGGCAVLNHYGPTETTVGSLTFEATAAGAAARAAATVPIGRPIAGTVVHVLDPAGQPLPPGVPGELYIGGAGLARGYLGDQQQTARRFVELAIPGEGRRRLYRTGDLVRILPGGEIEFLGRVDEQVKVRGFRVEPGEVEAALRSHPLVAQAAVIARQQRPGEARLIAYLTAPDGPPPPEQLREHLRRRLPEHMLPAAFVVLERLPLSAAGKLDRAALPEPPEGGGDQRPYSAPRTATERALASRWAELLGLERVGRDQDFFELGGHSLLATRLVAWVRATLGVALPLGVLFEASTVAALAEAIEQAAPAEEDELLAELERLSDEEAEELLVRELDAGEQR